MLPLSNSIISQSLQGWAVPPVQHSLYRTRPNYCKILSLITHMSCQDILCLILPETVQPVGQCSAAGMALLNWCKSSQHLPCEAREPREVETTVLFGGDGLEREWSHCLSASKTQKGGLCLPGCEEKREKGCWQLSRGWLLVKCDLFLALRPSSYLKTRYLGSV